MRLAWGILLAGGAGGITGWLVVDNAANGPKYTPQLLGQALPMTPRLSPLAVFCSGLALGVIFCVGVWLIAAGRRHHVRRSAQRQSTLPATPALPVPPALPALPVRTALPARTAASPRPAALPVRSAEAPRPALLATRQIPGETASRRVRGRSVATPRR